MYPSITTVRDRTQICKARRTSVSTAEEFIAVMKTLKSKGIVALRSQDHMIAEIERCCNTSNSSV